MFKCGKNKQKQQRVLALVLSLWSGPVYRSNVMLHSAEMELRVFEFSKAGATENEFL